MKRQGPKILIVGSGAVGAVFAEHLTRAGAEAAFLVRDPNSANARMPRSLHHISLRGKTDTVRQALENFREVRGDWDQCWLCLPSTALDSDWLHGELARLDRNVPIINWTPDLEDRARLEAALQRPVDMGLIGFISYQAPLPGEHEPADGIAYLLPPRAATLERTPAGRRAATLLKNGGLHATTSGNLPWLAARLTAAVVTLMAALETEDWSLTRLEQGTMLPVAAEAAREAIVISADYLGVRARLAQHLPRAALYRPLLNTLPRVAPFDLETYLGYHFGKVSDQTRLMLDTWIDEGKRRERPVTALSALRGALSE